MPGTPLMARLSCLFRSLITTTPSPCFSVTTPEYARLFRIGFPLIAVPAKASIFMSTVRATSLLRITCGVAFSVKPRS
jgi:hypothetical protein